MAQNQDDLSNPGRRYVGDRLYQDLRSFIFRSEADTALKSERKLTEEYDICIGTVRRVMAQLVEEGLIYKIHGKGNFVKASGKKAKNKIIFADAWSSGFHPFFSRKLDGIIDEAEKRGFFLQVCSIHLRHEKERGMLLPAASADDVAGLIYPYENNSFLSEIRKANPGLPIVSDQANIGFSCSAEVNIDYQQVGKMGAQYLRQQSVNNPLVIYNNDSVLSGFEHEWPGKSHIRKVHASDMGALEQVMLRMSKADYDGLFFGDDIIATEILARGEPSVSRQAIISYHNIDNKDLPDSIATLDVNGYEFGRLTVHVLCSLMGNPYHSNTRTLYIPTLCLPS